MRPNDLVTWLRASPFVPFRIRMTSGRTFDIRHPEMLRVGRTTVNVFSFIGQAADIYERMEMISPLLIESVEPIEAAHPA
jgi:hypothetical protein